MKSVVYKRFGNTDVLEPVDESKPVIASREVLVKVRAVSINPMDWKIRKGEMKLMSGSKFPKHTGVDFAGIIEDIGKDVAHFKIGDEVFGVVKNPMKEGALAEYAAVPATSVWPKPAALSFAQAASIPIVGAAAVTVMEKIGDVTANSRILVNGATGGFGMFLLQLLKQKGADVTAVASTKAIDVARKWGANHVIDYVQENVYAGNQKYDVVIDLSGKMGFARAKPLMASHARFLNPTPKPIEIPVSFFNNLFSRKKHIVILSPVTKDKIDVSLKAIGLGLQVRVSEIFPFDRAAEAYRYAEKGGVIGKVAIQVD